MNDRVAVAGLFAHQPDGRCSGVQTDRNEPDRFRGNLQQKSPKFLRSLRSRGGCWSGVQTDRPAVGAASRPTSGRSFIYYYVDLYVVFIYGSCTFANVQGTRLQTSAISQPFECEQHQTCNSYICSHERGCSQTQTVYKFANIVSPPILVMTGE